MAIVVPVGLLNSAEAFEAHGCLSDDVANTFNDAGGCFEPPPLERPWWVSRACAHRAEFANNVFHCLETDEIMYFLFASQSQMNCYFMRLQANGVYIPNTLQFTAAELQDAVVLFSAIEFVIDVPLEFVDVGSLRCWDDLCTLNVYRETHCNEYCAFHILRATFVFIFHTAYA